MMPPAKIPPSSPAAHRPATPRRRRKDARPAELLAAALDLFVEKGFAATRLEDVAARAGVAKGTLYLYFDNKEALFRAVVEQGIVPLFVAVESEIADYRGSAADLLIALLSRWQRDVGQTPLAGLYKLIIAEANNFPELARYYNDAVIARGRALLGEVLRHGIASGEFRAVDDVDSAIDAIIAPLLMLFVWRFSLAHCARAVDPEAMLRTHFELLMHGLCVQKRKP